MYQVVVRGVTSALTRIPTATKVRVLSYVQKAGYAGIKTVSDLLKSIKNNPALAALTASGMIEAGISVIEIFSDEDKADPGVADLRARLERQQSRLAQTVNKDSELHIGGNREDLSDLKAIIKFARDNYGSPANIRQQHTLLRAFTELDNESLELGLDLFWSV